MLPARVLARRIKFSPISTVGLLCTCSLALWFSADVHAQTPMPHTNGGRDSVFAPIDYAQIYATRQIWPPTDESLPHISKDETIDLRGVSPLDLDAPKKAVEQFNIGVSLMKSQRSKDAIKPLQKAIAIYPRFVSAHNALGLAYLDQQDPRAKQEFENAANLDGNFPWTFLNLGVLEALSNDFASAESDLAKAASLKPDEPKILSVWAFAQNESHKYAEALQTVQRLHSLDHRGMASVHYIAAAAAQSLRDFDTMQRELRTLLQEDPSNPMAPAARNALSALADRKKQGTQLSVHPGQIQAVSLVGSSANSDYLKQELAAAAKDPDAGACATCVAPEPTAAPSTRIADLALNEAPPANLFTIRRSVDETALFFAVSDRGRMVNDLSLSDIHVFDDNKPPQKILQFLPQSKLPLRLGLLIDTSGSVEGRFPFEKRAAQKFMEKVLNRDTDLAFVAGFNTDVSIAQDFSSDPELLSQGIDQLANGGETALFDAVYVSCWKLAAYPDAGRVARVLVVLTDGEDNASHRTLNQAIGEADAAGVTVYTVSTSELSSETDADKILGMIAERSGGESIFPVNLRALERYLDKLPEVIRSRYMIAYKAAGFEPNGKYRTIRVKAEKDGKHLAVHSRRGYYARLELAQN